MASSSAGAVACNAVASVPRHARGWKQGSRSGPGPDERCIRGPLKLFSCSVHEHMLDNDSPSPVPDTAKSFTTVGWIGRGSGVLPLASPDASRDDSGPTISGQIHLHAVIPSFGVCRHPPTRSNLHASSILIENVRAHALSGSESQTGQTK